MTDDTGFIGVEFGNSGILPIHYISDYNINELDYLFWNTASFQTQFDATLSTLFSSKNINSRIKTKEIFQSRTKEMISFAENGGNLIIFTGGDTEIKRLTKEHLDPTAISIFKPIRKSGRRYQKIEDPELQSIISRIYPDIFYSYTLNNKKFKNLITVPKTGETISSYHITERGGIILAMPYPPGNFVPTGEIKSLIKKIKTSPKEKIQPLIPEWTDSYKLKEEKQKIEENENITLKIQKLENEIKSNEKSISRLREWKNLFASHDSPLEKTAVQAFESLGFRATLGPETHCDIICVKDNTVLAVEAKGLTKNTKPKNVTQCNRWVSDITSALDHTTEESDGTIKAYIKCLEKLGVNFPTSSEDWEVKGVLLINTFRDSPLEARENPSELSFNDQVVKQMRRHKMAGLTGIQLLNMVMEAQINPDARGEIRRNLIEANTELELHKNWDAHLSKDNSDD